LFVDLFSVLKQNDLRKCWIEASRFLGLSGLKQIEAGEKAFEI